MYFTLICTFNLNPLATDMTGQNGCKLQGFTDSYDLSYEILVLSSEM